MSTYGGRRAFDIALPRNLAASGPARFSLGVCPSCALLARNNSCAEITYRLERARSLGVRHIAYWLLEWKSNEQKADLLLPEWWSQIRRWRHDAASS